METISSSLTFFYKFVFTTLWSGVSLAMYVGNMSDVSEIRWQDPALWIAVTAYIWWTLGRLKRVGLDGTTLVISNYRADIRVPARDIAEVRQDRLGKFRAITLTFKTETPFGRAVTFIPPVSFRLFSEDVVVGRLRSVANADSEIPV